MDSEELLNFAELDSQIQNIIDRSELQYNLKIQLEEIDFLRAMYYQDKEFVIDEDILRKVSNYITESASEVPPILEFVIRLTFKSLSAEVQVALPKLYPNLQPKIYLRSNQLSRNQQNRVNNDLETFLHSLDRGTICVYECISWINDNISTYLPKEKPEHEVNKSRTVQRELFTRYWLYSHHIYSKEKRRDILNLSSKYQVTGFCLSGKPGVICGEGSDGDCNEWWQHIRNMTWKKIVCKKIEEIETTTDKINSLRKFGDFVEINFQNLKGNKSNETHTDMGEFYRYLIQHNCEYMFKDYFGIEGKTPGSH